MGIFFLVSEASYFASFQALLNSRIDLIAIAISGRASLITFGQNTMDLTMRFVIYKLDQIYENNRSC